MNLIYYTKLFLSKKKPSSECHRAVKVLFVESIYQNNAHLNPLDSKRRITCAVHDFRSLISHDSLDDRKKKPIGKSHINNITIYNAIEVILASYSTVACIVNMVLIYSAK